MRYTRSSQKKLLSKDQQELLKTVLFELCGHAQEVAAGLTQPTRDRILDVIEKKLKICIREVVNNRGRNLTLDFRISPKVHSGGFDEILEIYEKSPHAFDKETETAFIQPIRAIMYALACEDESRLNAPLTVDNIEKLAQTFLSEGDAEEFLARRETARFGPAPSR